MHIISLLVLCICAGLLIYIYIYIHTHTHTRIYTLLYQIYIYIWPVQKYTSTFELYVHTYTHQLLYYTKATNISTYFLLAYIYIYIYIYIYASNLQLQGPHLLLSPANILCLQVHLVPLSNAMVCMCTNQVTRVSHTLLWPENKIYEYIYIYIYTAIQLSWPMYFSN
jgi:hypothetical protein